MFTTVATIYLHISVFVFSFILLFLYFVFAQDWPFSSPMWQMRVLAWSTILYPVIFLISLILWKFVNPKFFYLPLINLVISTLVLVYFLGYFLLSIPKNQKIVSEIESQNRIANTEELKNAPRDFVCDDGTFFSLDNKVYTDKNTYIVNYYNTFFMEHPEESYSSSFGVIDKNNRSVLQPRGDINEKEAQIWQKLKTCKNKDGKSLLDVYPEKTNP